MEMKLAQGIGANGLFGGTMLNLFEANVVALERRGEQVFLLQKPHRFTGGKDARSTRAVALSFGPSVIETAPIESFRGDSAVLIDVTNWFVSDLSGMASACGSPPRPRRASRRRCRSIGSEATWSR